MPGFTSVARADTFALPAGLLNAASGLVVFVEELTHILKLNSNGLAAAVDDNPYDSYQRMPWGDMVRSATRRPSPLSRPRRKH